MPGLLSGCGEDERSQLPPPAPTPVPGARERRTLHFDLSANGAIANAWLEAFNSASYRATLQMHDAASRARFRQTHARVELDPRR